MGDPRKLRKKFSKPTHPWQKTRIESEKLLLGDYGFKNKKELWKLNSKLSQFKSQVKDLIPRKDEQAEQHKRQLIIKLQKLNLIQENAVLEDILALTINDMCERRLQTIVLKKHLARSINQARQFIVHEHIKVGTRKITSPSYLISAKEEPTIEFDGNSPITVETHPEAIQKELKEVKKIKPEAKALEQEVKK